MVWKDLDRTAANRLRLNAHLDQRQRVWRLGKNLSKWAIFSSSWRSARFTLTSWSKVSKDERIVPVIIDAAEKRTELICLRWRWSGMACRNLSVGSTRCTLAWAWRSSGRMLSENASIVSPKVKYLLISTHTSGHNPVASLKSNDWKDRSSIKINEQDAHQKLLILIPIISKGTQQLQNFFCGRCRRCL